MPSPNAQVPYTLQRGSVPLLVSVPHAGREIPAELQLHYDPRALQVEDTDWHLERLYAFAAAELGASLIAPRFSRYVIDLNRPPEDTPMYPGANNTELCPTRFFTGEPLYRAGHEPDAAEVVRRLATYWSRYHDALAGELARLKAQHGHVVLLDGHSIKSRLPWLFDGQLHDLNLGTAGGTSCAPSLRDALAAVLGSQTGFSHVIDGRFKGGYITRHYGRPAEGQHAVQMEMCWSCYLGDEARPQDWSDAQAARALPLLRRLAQTLCGWTPT
jgi:N-formylglutamate deformylase